MGELALSLLVFAAALCVFWAVLWVCVLVPMEMAKARGRKPWVWLLIAMMASPLVAIILLMLVGEARRSGE